jgi:DNA-binding transcriptional MerR regulator
MKVSELSQKTSVPLPTIKFYIREGLLPSGARTGKNQADYGEKHVERLSLIVALRDDAGLSIETIARALRAADAATARENFVIRAIDALDQGKGVVAADLDPVAFERALTVVLRLAEERKWEVEPGDVAVRDAARAVVAIERGFPTENEESLGVYADVAGKIAECEIPDDWALDESPDAALRYAVLGTVLFEPFILALRRMAHVARTRSIVAKRAKKKPTAKR